VKTNRLYKILRVILVPIFKFIYRYEIVNEEYIPKEGRIIIAGNHKHALDPTLVISSTKRVIHFMVKRELHEGLIGFFLKRLATIPIDRTKKNVSATNSAIQVLENEEPLGMFPEGTRNKTDKSIMNFRHGAVSLASKTNSPIIPFAITGTFKPFKKGLKITYGEHFYVNDMDISKANELLMKKVTEMIQARN